MRATQAAIIGTSFSLLAIAPAIFIVWAIWTTGQVVNAVDVRLALAPWVALSASVLALTLSIGRLAVRPGVLEATVLGIGVAVAACEVLAFGYAVAAVALGIPAAP